jgi:phosphoglycolate phosphatase-like HAD superfamily hydrolase
MFSQMRQKLAIQKPTDILMHVRSLPVDAPPPPTPATPLNHGPTAALAIQAIERDAMTTQTPQPGLLELMSYLEKRSVRKALCTRNFPAPVKHLCEKFMPGVHFDPIITRETTNVIPKPSPMGIWRCAEVWAAQDTLAAPASAPSHVDDVAAKRGDEKRAIPALSKLQGLDPLEIARRHLGSGLIMVGDSLDDMAAGYRAGAATILLTSEETEEGLLNGHEYVDLVVRRLDEIIPVLERGFEGRG